MTKVTSKHVIGPPRDFRANTRFFNFYLHSRFATSRLALARWIRKAVGSALPLEQLLHTGAPCCSANPAIPRALNSIQMLH